MTAVLGDDELRAALSELPGWHGDRDAISRSFVAPNFRTGIRVVDDVADVAEQLDHHPDIDVRWTTVKFTLATHSAGGVTARDLELARRIDDVAREHAAT